MTRDERIASSLDSGIDISKMWKTITELTERNKELLVENEQLNKTGE